MWLPLLSEANSVFAQRIRTDRPEQTVHSVVSDQGLHYLPLIQQFLYTSTGSDLKLGVLWPSQYC